MDSKVTLLWVQPLCALVLCPYLIFFQITINEIFIHVYFTLMALLLSLSLFRIQKDALFSTTTIAFLLTIVAWAMLQAFDFTHYEYRSKWASIYFQNVCIQAVLTLHVK